jgi:hypothetical protein
MYGIKIQDPKKTGAGGNILNFGLGDILAEIGLACAWPVSRRIIAPVNASQVDVTGLRFMKFLLIFALLFVPPAGELVFAQTAEFQGFVKTAEGQPIENVYIEDGDIFTAPKTDEKGFFKLSSKVLISDIKSVVFDKKGFVPKIVLLSPAERNLNITLEPEKSGDFRDMPTCKFARSNQNNVVGQYLKLTVPKKLKIKSGVDTDYIYYSIGFTENKKTYWLNGGRGNLYGSLYPSDELRSELQNYTYRRTSVGIDWRGTTKAGKHWRYFGASSAFESYYYTTESKEAADFFDKILDGVCFQPNQ